jgi:two-component system response regulator HupR/HoxA
VGLLQKADRGTIFLNGIDTVSETMQMALLRLVRERSYEPVGGHESLTSGARLLAGAHRDLRQCVAEGAFRGDLFFALAVTELHVPPLRGRPGDIARLAEKFLHAAAEEHGKPICGFSDSALEFLEGYDWPGNLPELRNEVVRMLIMAQDVTLGPELISRHILQADPGESGADRQAADLGIMDGTLKDRVELMEMRILRETMTRMKWNKSRAASELGLSRVGLRAKLDRYGIEPRAASAEED